MSKNHDLFKLIDNMSVKEKQYFKRNIFSSKSRKLPLYATLFKIIEGTEADEIIVKDNKKHHDDIFIEKIKDERLKNNLAIYKNTLYEKILESLRSFHAQDSIQIKLNGLLQDINILLEKELFKQGYKRLKIAKRLATIYDYPNTLLTLINIERRLVRRLEHQKQNILLGELNELSNSCVNEMSMRVIILNLYDSFHTKMRNEILNKEEIEVTRKEVENIGKRINSEKKSSFHLLRDYHTLLFNLYYQERKIDEAIVQQEEIYKLYTVSPIMIREYPDRYASLIYNYMILLTNRKEYKRVISLIKEIRMLTKSEKEGGYGIKYHNIHSRVFQLSYFMELSLFLMEDSHEEALNLLPTIEEGLEIHRNNIPVASQIMFFQNIAMTYFLNKQYSSVLEWINRILSLEDTHKIKMNTQLLSRLLQVVIHYELQDYGLVADYFVPSFRKHLNRYKTHPEIKKYAPTYRILLSALSKASNATKDKKKKIFQDLAEQAKEIPLFATILPWIQEKAQ